MGLKGFVVVFIDSLHSLLTDILSAIYQGGIVTAMTINYGVLLGFVPSNDSKVVLQSGQFEGVIQFRVDDLQKPIDNPENINWESYARGAVYALQNNGYVLKKAIFLV